MVLSRLRFKKLFLEPQALDRPVGNLVHCCGVGLGCHVGEDVLLVAILSDGRVAAPLQPSMQRAGASTEQRLSLCYDKRFQLPKGVELIAMRPGFEEGGTGRLSESDSRETVRYWQSKSPEERVQAILDIRTFYYEEIRPGTGATRLDRSIGGTRKLRG